MAKKGGPKSDAFLLSSSPNSFGGLVFRCSRRPSSIPAGRFRLCVLMVLTLTYAAAVKSTRLLRTCITARSLGIGGYLFNSIRGYLLVYSFHHSELDFASAHFLTRQVSLS
jgi:hypothetical protein